MASSRGTGCAATSGRWSAATHVGSSSDRRSSRWACRRSSTRSSSASFATTTARMPAAGRFLAPEVSMTSADEPPVAVAGPPLRALDRLLRRWRIREVRRFIPPGSTVLDVGCHDGALFRILSGRISGGVGLDPLVERSESRGRFRFVSGTFPDDLASNERFDVITLMAVLEHVEPGRLRAWGEACSARLAPGGVVIATVPSAKVDGLLDLLARVGLVAGMSLEEHHGFDPSDVPRLFGSDGFSLVRHDRFELGMNNLFVFRSTDAARRLTTEPA